MSNQTETQMIAIGQLRSSSSQPRKHFNQEALDELTESMKQFGFTLSTILVRPIKPTNGDVRQFEIVVGERRVRAARAAGIAEAPCCIADFSDSDVLSIQLVENLQRDDLTAMEEANGYVEALKLRDGRGALIFTIESLAKKIGRSERSIYLRLSLCDLPIEAQKAVELGRLAPMTAALIGRIPDEKARLEATKLILHPRNQRGPLSMDEAEKQIHEHFVRGLRQAKFDQEDKDLLPVELDPNGQRIKGGACTDCPFKRTGHQPVCVNPSCFDEKQTLEWKTWQEKETNLDGKRRAVSEEQSLQLYPFGNQLASHFNLVDLKQWPAEELKPGISKGPGNWNSLTKDKELEVIVARDRTGDVHELVNRDAAMEAARQNGHDIFKTVTREKHPDSETRKEQEHEKDQRRETNKATLVACIELVHKRVTAKTIADVLRLEIDREIASTRPHADFLKRYSLPIGCPVAKQIARRPVKDLVAMLVELVIAEAGFSYDSLHQENLPWLKVFGVDYAKVEKQLAKGTKK